MRSIGLVTLLLACGRAHEEGAPSAAPEPTSPPAGGAPTVGGPASSAPGSTSSSSSSGGDPGPSGPPALRFVGRFDTSDPAGPKAAWPGTRILARFSGTRLSVTLREHADDYMDGAPSFWDVTIDKGPPTKIAMTADDTAREFELASALPPGVHQVELYKRTETQNGITQFLGFDFHGGTLLAPPVAQKRHIEVIGDSASSGFGIEILDAPNLDCPGPDHQGAYQNFHQSWGAVLGEIFDAEVHAVVYSGKGITRNIWRPDTDPLEKYYPRANPDPAIAATAPMFDLKTWVPDVIVMKMGANDLAEGLPEPVPGPVTADELTAATRAFVATQLRARAPDAEIILLVPDDSSRPVVTQVMTTVANERAGAGDAKIHTVITNPATPGELVACDAHGTPAYHRRIANEVAQQVKRSLAW